MGQRSQIYVRYEKEDNINVARKILAARYYQWNYGECMISRARYSMEWLKTNHEYLAYYPEKIPRSWIPISI